MRSGSRLEPAGRLRVRTVRVEDDVWNAIEEQAHEHGLSNAEFVRRILRDHVVGVRFEQRFAAVEERIEVLDSRVAAIGRAVLGASARRPRQQG